MRVLDEVPAKVFKAKKKMLSKQGCVTVVRSSATPPAKVFKAKQKKSKSFQNKQKKLVTPRKEMKGRRVTAVVC